VRAQVLSYVRKWIPQQRCAVLAGNSVHFDRAFLANEMPALLAWLHYRIVGASDFSSSPVLLSLSVVFPPPASHVRIHS
jgi:oligoribonuclease